MKQGKIIIISGPSGSGKTTLYQKLLKTKRSNLVKSISVTTRPMRVGEKHTRDYFFVSLKMFLYKKRSGHFLEFEKVFDNYYGTPAKGVRDILNLGKNVLLCIDVKGAKTVFSKFPSVVRIFVKTPSLKILKNRLQSRGSEDKKTLALRLARAKEELKEVKMYDYVVVNDDLKKATERLETIIYKEVK